MTVEEMRVLLDETGIPFAYHLWKKPPPALPWGVFRETELTQFFADGVSYYSRSTFQIELYTDRKDPPLEARLSTALTAAGIAYSKNEQYIESEELYEIFYECEV